MAYNKEQLEAIKKRNSNILVSAPAGSGKTSILVGRIIGLLKEGYNIDELLVLTFTDAAASEMKQRLSKELNTILSNEILDSDLYNHLNKQLLLLNNAYITNFHSFCKLLLTKYGYMINVLPGFEINSDPSLLKKEALKECEEKWVENKEYRDFFSLYFTSYNFNDFENILLSIDGLSHSIDDFHGFVKDVLDNNYDINSINNWHYYSVIKDIIRKELENAENKLMILREYCETNDLYLFFTKPEKLTSKNKDNYTPYDALYEYIRTRLDILNTPIKYNDLAKVLKQKPKPSFRMNWKEVDVNVKEDFDNLKDNILKPYYRLIDNYFDVNEEEFIAKLKLSKKAIEILVGEGNLLDQFQMTYQRKKKELNQLDFNDLEKYAYILLEKQSSILNQLYCSLKEIMVDEYQDTNAIQERLLNKIACYKEPNINMFMVGDMKQSIYRFRNADPKIFKNKFDRYYMNNNNDTRIDLKFNYRSHKIVLDSINFIFNSIMDENFGGLKYYEDDGAKLNYDFIGKKQDKLEYTKIFNNQREFNTEVLLNQYSKDTTLNKYEVEAHMVAQRIIKLKNEFKIDGKPIEYKDIAILMRSSPTFIDFKKVFDKYNIPNLIVLSQGFLQATEVITILSLLKAICNPYDDIALLSSLRAPYSFSNIDEELIAKLRINKDNSLYENLKTSNEPVIKSFLSTFNELRKFSYNNCPYDLLNKIYEVSQYPIFVSSLINGKQRYANLELLLEKVRELQDKYPYLEDIINIIENSQDSAPGNVTSDDDAISFMTIHKSKGLEFPVVFVCNLQKKFNQQDTRDKVIIDKDIGIAIKPRLYKTVDDIDNVITEYQNPYLKIISRNIQIESINEEMRILYVALTRAKSKLILTGVIDDIEEIVNIQKNVILSDSFNKTNKVILNNNIRNSNNYLHWILAGIIRHPNIIKQCINAKEKNSTINIKMVENKENLIDNLIKNAKELESLHYERILNFDYTNNAMFSLNITNDDEIKLNIPKLTYNKDVITNKEEERYYNYKYPYDTSIPYTIGVTTLAGKQDDHYIHKIMDKEDDSNIKATDKGTIVHLLMSYLTFKNDNIDTLISTMSNEKLIDNKQKEILISYKENINDFINSDIYKLISKSKYIYQEKPFTYLDGNQIVNGIFDLVFINNDIVYVLDYKTDRISNNYSNDELINKHRFQLEYYKKVLEKTYKFETKAIIYYLHNGRYVEF